MYFLTCCDRHVSADAELAGRHTRALCGRICLSAVASGPTRALTTIVLGMRRRRFPVRFRPENTL
jgi:hypothetical protein